VAAVVTVPWRFLIGARWMGIIGLPRGPMPRRCRPPPALHELAFHRLDFQLSPVGRASLTKARHHGGDRAWPRPPAPSPLRPYSDHLQSPWSLIIEYLVIPHSVGSAQDLYAVLRPCVAVGWLKLFRRPSCGRPSPPVSATRCLTRALLNLRHGPAGHIQAVVAARPLGPQAGPPGGWGALIPAGTVRQPAGVG